MRFGHLWCRPRPAPAVRAVVAGFAAALAVLVPATSAAADVTVRPSEAGQGDAARLWFRIANSSPTATITKVEFRLPDDAPIAEVYPMSAADWAPAMTMRRLDKALPGLHGPPQVEVVTTVTYTAVPGKGVPPGGSTELSLSVGPLPTVDRLVISVVQTSSDGAVVRYVAPPAPGVAARAGDLPAPVIVLRPAGAAGAPGAGQSQAADAGAGQPPAAGADEAADEPDSQAADEPARDRGGWSLWWALGAVLLVGVIAAVSLIRQRRERLPNGDRVGLRTSDDLLEDSRAG